MVDYLAQQPAAAGGVAFGVAFLIYLFLRNKNKKDEKSENPFKKKKKDYFKFKKPDWSKISNKKLKSKKSENKLVKNRELKNRIIRSESENSDSKEHSSDKEQTPEVSDEELKAEKKSYQELSFLIGLYYEWLENFNKYNEAIENIFKKLSKHSNISPNMINFDWNKYSQQLHKLKRAEEKIGYDFKDVAKNVSRVDEELASWISEYLQLLAFRVEQLKNITVFLKAWISNMKKRNIIITQFENIINPLLVMMEDSFDDVQMVKGLSKSLSIIIKNAGSDDKKILDDSFKKLLSAVKK